MAADKQARRGVSWKASCAWALTALWRVGAGPAAAGVHAGLGWSLCAHGPAKHSRVTGSGTQRDACLMLRLDNLRSQGQHSEERLKHLEKPSLWQAHISPSGPPLPLPRGLSPGRKRLCLYLIPNPLHPTLSSLDGEQRDAAHTNPSLMACHGGHKCPAVRLWVVHLHRA